MYVFDVHLESGVTPGYCVSLVFELDIGVCQVVEVIDVSQWPAVYREDLIAVPKR